jgi:branched-subunit amino acid aminotransferase/4-amino-4-deoxychorismate lyase
MLASVNGKITAHPAVPLGDPGFLHGAAVFTTLAATPQPVRLPQHLARLRHSCTAMRIEHLPPDHTLTAWLSELLCAAALPAARLRITVTRGQTAQPGEATYPGEGTYPGVYMTAAPLERPAADVYETGAAALVVEPHRLNAFDLYAGHKTSAYAARLAALGTARAGGAFEAIWLDTRGEVVSGSVSNVFMVKSGTLYTPLALGEATHTAALPGITRHRVMELAGALGISSLRQPLSLEELSAADECFLTSSIIGILPIVRLGPLPIGAGRPGPVYAQLRQAMLA